MRLLLDVSAVPAQPVGAGVYTIALAEGLDARAEIELHLLARRDDGERWSTRCPGAVVHASVPTRRPLRLAWEQTSTAAIVRAVNPDLWHGPHYTMPLRLAVPAVVTMHDLTFFDHPEWHERTKVLYFRRMIRAAARRAAVVVCGSEYSAARLAVHTGRRDDVVVVPYGVDASRFAPGSGDGAEDRARLERHGIRPPFVAFAGTAEPRKDLPSLVRAFAAVAATKPDLRLVVAGGDGWGTTAVRNAIAASGVATRIIRPGYVDDDTLHALFRQAAVIAYPSLEEGFGFPALEAMASGTPLVTTRGSSLEEVADDAAVLVPAGDTDALSRALARVLDNIDGVADRLRAAGPARAAAYSWDRTVDGHVAVYARALATRVPA
jgi:glycosyltransferase involved in cell wall biosynthesis